MNLFRKRLKRMWDFDGRCSECWKLLPLKISVISKQSVNLSVQECEYHPGKSGIFWPQRDDIIHVEVAKE